MKRLIVSVVVLFILVGVTRDLTGCTRQDTPPLTQSTPTPYRAPTIDLRPPSLTPLPTLTRTTPTPVASPQHTPTPTVVVRDQLIHTTGVGRKTTETFPLDSPEFVLCWKGKDSSIKGLTSVTMQDRHSGTTLKLEETGCFAYAIRVDGRTIPTGRSAVMDVFFIVNAEPGAEWDIQVWRKERGQ